MIAEQFNAGLIHLCQGQRCPTPPPLMGLLGLYQDCLINLHSMDELSIIEEKIQDKIVQTKIQMDRTMERTETDRLWPIIETMKWVLNEILEVGLE